MVEHPLREREVVGSNPGRAIPKALKMVPVATLRCAQHYKASTGFSSPINKYPTINIEKLTKSLIRKCPKIINVCIHRRTVWKIGSHAKYVILLKYRDYYYYYYRYFMNIVAKSFIIMTASPVYARSIAYLGLGLGFCSFGFCVWHICSLIASYRMSAEISCFPTTVNS